MIYTLGEDKIDGATSAPFIKTKYFDLDCDINSFDIIIFTSKKAIISLNKAYPSWVNKIIYTVGKKTKEFALSKGATNVISSKKESSYDMVGELQYIVKNKKVLYVRAKKTLTDIKSKLNNLCDFTEKIAYETIFIKPLFKLKKGSIIIFSSPSTIKSFSCFYDIKDFKIIVIGKSTAKSLDTNIKYEMPSSPSLELCVKKAKEMLN